MKCLKPFYVNMKDTWGIPGYLPVPCGKCINCLSLRRLQWTFRLHQEMLDSYYSAFATLTYDEDKLPTLSCEGVDDVPTLDYSDVQKFLKRFRYYLKQLNVSLRYFVVGEYGSHTFRPHYHALFFFTAPTREIVLNTAVLFPSLFRKSWPLGSILDFQQLSGDGASGYCSKYVNKFLRPQLFKDQIIEKSLKSTLIGRGYITRFKAWHLQDPATRVFAYFNGYKVPLPRTFRLKIFGDHGKLPPLAAYDLLLESDLDDKRKFEVCKTNYLAIHGSLEGFVYDDPIQNSNNERDWLEYLKHIQSKDNF